eukprot:Blabericola_migrator_1__6231@NODE_3143_length_2009_cov_324_462925_g1967_i0_p1_GENE_NODE_3143_length_2009_cov_324_462925_g1967_i0NODE_3143_length_2009_cov_324_462925_g1967_i0_p1_ORF_typecomplete_len284_score57_50HSCB_C/PF07743_13/0_24_NODE_3143_length_2009_cov_324_462925_g1967_i06031454
MANEETLSSPTTGDSEATRAIEGQVADEEESSNENLRNEFNEEDEEEALCASASHFSTEEHDDGSDKGSEQFRPQGGGDLEPVDYFEDDGAQILKLFHADRPRFDGVSHHQVQSVLKTFDEHIASCDDISNLTTVKAFATILFGPAHEWITEKRKAPEPPFWGDLRAEFLREFDFTKEAAWFYLHQPTQKMGQSVWNYWRDQRYARSFWPKADIQDESRLWLKGLKDPVAIGLLGRNAVHLTMDEIGEKMTQMSHQKYRKKVFNRPFNHNKVRRPPKHWFDDD